MKAFVVILMALVVTSSGNQLTDDILDFVKLLPPNKINEIIAKYIVIPEFQEVLSYVMHGQEFKEIIAGLQAMPEFVKVIQFIKDSGLDVYEELNNFNKIIREWTFLKSNGVHHYQKKDIVVQCRDEIRLLLSKDKITTLHDYKMANSSAFRYFSDRIKSEEFIILVINLAANKTFKNSMITLKEHGVDVEDAVSFDLEMTGFREIKPVSPLLNKIFNLVNKKFEINV